MFIRLHSEWELNALTSDITCSSESPQSGPPIRWFNFWGSLWLVAYCQAHWAEDRTPFQGNIFDFCNPGKSIQARYSQRAPPLSPFLPAILVWNRQNLLLLVADTCDDRSALILKLGFWDSSISVLLLPFVNYTFHSSHCCYRFVWILFQTCSSWCGSSEFCLQIDQPGKVQFRMLPSCIKPRL